MWVAKRGGMWVAKVTCSRLMHVGMWCALLRADFRALRACGGHVVRIVEG